MATHSDVHGYLDTKFSFAELKLTRPPINIRPRVCRIGGGVGSNSDAS